MIQLKVPCRLEFRDLALRTVAAACRSLPEAGAAVRDQVLSAVGEAFNNVVLHGRSTSSAELELELEPRDDRLVIRIIDHGHPFDPTTFPPPDLEALPESGLGVFIMRSFMDEVTYVAGPPNVLSLVKYLHATKVAP